MDNTDKLFLAFCIGVIAGVLLVGLGNTSDFRAQAISHHAAHYDQTTGDFTWNQ